jgi:hypothetical protein
MLSTEFYNGQGLGNQLWCYTVTRSLAKRYGYEFGIESPHKFKAFELFPNLKSDIGTILTSGEGPEGGPPTKLPEGITHYYKEKYVMHPQWNCHINPIDQNLFRLPPNTKIDGCLQAEQYIEENKADIKRWLEVDSRFDEKKYSSDDWCVINFRGTDEYKNQPHVFLPKKYWDNSIEVMRKINPSMNFIVVTDDVVTAREFFPQFIISHEGLEHDYGIIHNAHYSIISNSTFPWFALWTSNTIKKVIAPKYWARHNISNGFWSQGESLTKGWFYMDRDGILQDHNTCKEQYDRFKKQFYNQYYIQL